MEAVASIADPKIAAQLLDPMRVRILQLAREPLSASQFAERLGLQRQRVNYHVKKLREAGLLGEVGRREKRNLTEVLYQASAARYVIDPAALGPLAPEPGAPGLVSRFETEVRLADAQAERHFARDVEAAVSRATEAAGDRGRPYRLSLMCYQKEKPNTP